MRRSFSVFEPGAIQKQENIDRAEMCRASMEHVRREGDQKDAMMESFSRHTRTMIRRWKKRLEKWWFPLQLDQQPVDQQQTDLSNFLRMLGNCTAVPSMQEKPHTEV